MTQTQEAAMDDETFLSTMEMYRRSHEWQEFEDALRGVLADHENVTRDASGADTHAARRRTVDKIEALYADRRQRWS